MISCNFSHPRNACSPSFLIVFGMNTVSMSLSLNQKSSTISSPCGRRSTFGSQPRPSCSSVIFMCDGRSSFSIPVLHRQSPPSSWMLSFNQNDFKLRHPSKAKISIFRNDEGAVKDSRAERWNAMHRISSTTEPESKMTCFKFLQLANAYLSITSCCFAIFE